MQRGIDSPERYLLMIWWQTLENHTVDFRQGPLFTEWRGFIGPFLAGPPHVEHFDLALASAYPDAVHAVRRLSARSVRSAL